MKTAEQKLVDSRILPAIDKLDFSRIKHKLMTTEDGENWTFQEVETAEREYKRFLTLVKLNPKLEIVPTKTMDKFWHQHILDTVAYHNDCLNVFGYFVHHFPYFGIYGKQDRENLSKTFENTKELYFKTFGENIDKVEASRCKDHSCHVESECACRTSGACKNKLENI